MEAVRSLYAKRGREQSWKWAAQQTPTRLARKRGTCRRFAVLGVLRVLSAGVPTSDGLVTSKWKQHRVSSRGNEGSRFVASAYTPTRFLLRRNDTLYARRALNIGATQGRLALLPGIRGRIGIEWVRDRFHEEILEIVLVEHLVDFDCTVDGIPGRVPVRIACRRVDGVRGIDRIRSVRVCH